MKKLLTFFSIGILFFGKIQAQETNVAMKTINTPQIPAVIMAALQRDFPAGEPAKWGLLPANIYDANYKIEYQKDGGGKPDYYNVELKGENLSGNALYDTEGNLISYRAKIEDEELPQNIVDFVKSKYPNAVIQKDNEIIKEGKDQSHISYKIHILNGKKHEHILVDQDGKISRLLKI